MTPAPRRTRRALALLLAVLAGFAPVAQSLALCCAPTSQESLVHASAATAPADAPDAALTPSEPCHEGMATGAASIATAEASGSPAAGAVDGAGGMGADCFSDCLDMLQLSLAAQQLEAPSLFFALTTAGPRAARVLPAHPRPLLRPPSA